MLSKQPEQVKVQRSTVYSITTGNPPPEYITSFYCRLKQVHSRGETCWYHDIVTTFLEHSWRTTKYTNLIISIVILANGATVIIPELMIAQTSHSKQQYSTVFKMIRKEFVLFNIPPVVPSLRPVWCTVYNAFRSESWREKATQRRLSPSHWRKWLLSSGTQTTFLIHWVLDLPLMESKASTTSEEEIKANSARVNELNLRPRHHFTCSVL